MNNKMNLGIAMMLTASLTVALLSIPSKIAIAQIPPENQTMQAMPPQMEGTEMMSIDTQLRELVRSNHPLLADIADRIQTMDAQETLRYTLGIEIVADMLKIHAGDLILNQTAGSQTTTP
jgi:hypothetical protein